MAYNTTSHWHIPKDFVHLRLNDILPAVHVHHKCDHVVHPLHECLQAHIREYIMLVVITAHKFMHGVVGTRMMLTQESTLLEHCWFGTDAKVVSYVQLLQAHTKFS